MFPSVRTDACADQINKKPNLLIEKHKIITSEKYHSQDVAIGIAQVTVRQ